VALRNSERRRLIIATTLIATYLLAVSFVMAMGAIISMYGGAPKVGQFNADIRLFNAALTTLSSSVFQLVTSPGYVLVTGLLCLVLDLVHLKYGVEVHLGNPNPNRTVAHC
jgi:hypothetical protein